MLLILVCATAFTLAFDSSEDMATEEAQRAIASAQQIDGWSARICCFPLYLNYGENGPKSSSEYRDRQHSSHHNLSYDRCQHVSRQKGFMPKERGHCLQVKETLSISPEVCGDVVPDDEARREEEPKYPVKNVVRDELELRHDHADCDDGPRQLTNLEGAITAPNGRDKTKSKRKQGTSKGQVIDYCSCMGGVFVRVQPF